MVDNILYSIQKLNKDHYLIFGESYARIEDLFDNISQDLQKKKFKGKLSLDLLLSNGNNSSRFFEINFNGKTLDLDSLKKVKKPNEEILNHINSYLKLHKEVLYNGVLSTAEIEKYISIL